MQQDPSNSKHNEYEVRLLDARHRSALDFVSLLEETIPCVDCEGASPAHRVRAAIIATKVAIDFGQRDRVDWLYRQISPILADPSVCERDRLEIETIYRTDRGDGIVPLEDLNRLAETARLVDGEFGYSRALITAASACRQSARYQEGLSFVSRAADHAMTNKFHTRLFEISLAAVLLHIAAGESSIGSQALENTEKYPIGTGNNRLRNEIHYHAARLALENGDLAKAEIAFGSIDSPASTFSASRKGYYLALEIRIAFAARGPNGGHRAPRR